MSRLLPTLRGVPFPEQIVAIETAVSAGKGAAVLDDVITFRDHEPLAHLVGLMSQAGQLSPLATEMAARLLALPDTGVRRVLRALENTADAPAFAVALDAEAQALPVDRMVVTAMIDRWLKNTAPAVRKGSVDTAITQCRRAVSENRVANLDDASLMRLPGSSYMVLRAMAMERGCGEAWDARLDQFAAAVIDVLEAQPKSLSQANAEDLLSRQVYTDPGHFLIELLQNADDAGATHWRVRVHSDRVEVEHDGAPFDARDVVGILSIGQTTKGKEQIGFFGVGFKSVYDICERPQVYSGAFSFEIADVSLPRPLTRHATVAPGHTLLVLPLRDPDDATRAPARLFEHLENVPGEVLLTLNALQELDIRFGERRHHVRTRDVGHSRIRLDVQNNARTFLVTQTEATYPGARDTNRASSTPVMVALSLDQQGRPMPCGKRPTIYSYLPTGERSGLRFLVHAHFDLPVDRERLDLSSPWNQWAIEQIGPLLARAVRNLVQEIDEAPDGELARARVDAALSIVPLPEELGDDSYCAVTSQLGDVPFLPAAGGTRIPATAALLADDPRLSQALAGVALQGDRQVLAPITGRDAAVARFIGATPLALESVVALMHQDGRARASGDDFDAAWGDRLHLLAAVLGGSDADLSSLAAIACLPDTTGRARRPAELMRASGELRALLAPLVPLLRDDVDIPASAAFLDGLGVRLASTRDFVRAVSSADAGSTVVNTVGVARVLHHLMAAPAAELEACEQAFVVPTDEGPIAAVGDAFLTGTSRLADLVRTAPTRPPLVARACEAEFAKVLSRLGTPRLDLRTALALIARDALAIAEEQLLALHVAIDEQRDAIDHGLASQLAHAAIFPCADGSRRALVGEDRAHIPADDDIRALWPETPWIDPALVELTYVQRLGIPAVDADFVVQAVIAGRQPDEFRRAAFVYLASHADTLSTQRKAALIDAPVWPDVDGVGRPLPMLRAPSSHPLVAAVYALWPQARTIESGREPGSALHLARALGADHHVLEPDLHTVIDDVVASTAHASPAHNPMSMPALAEALTAALVAAGEQLPRARLDPVRDAAIYLCADGALRALGTWDAPSRNRGHRVSALRDAFSHGQYPLLDAGAAARFEPLLDALGIRSGSATDLVGSVHGAVEGLDAAAAATLRSALVLSARELARAPDGLRDTLSDLPLWPTASGLHKSHAVLRTSALRALVGDDIHAWVAELSHDNLSLLNDSADTHAAALDAVLRFAAPGPAIARTVGRLAAIDAPLLEQHALLASHESVARIAHALAGERDAPDNTSLAVNAREVLVSGRVHAADESELAILRDLDVETRLAAPAWAAAMELLSPGAVPQVTPLQVISALRDASTEPAPADTHPSLREPGARAHLHEWLLRHRNVIEADSQLAGILARACIVLSRQGVLRAPREFLFDDSLPDLGIDWNPSPDLPPALTAWLRRTYRPEAKQLRTMVEHLIDAADAAASAGDGDRLHDLLGHLARALRAGDAGAQLHEHARRFKLRKRLRVQTNAGSFDRPRTLLAPDARDADLIARFADPPPPSVSERYDDPAVLNLLRAAGCDTEVAEAALMRYAEGHGLRAGSDAVIALACYLAASATRVPSRRTSLDLTRRAWVPDRAGTTHGPSELYWPADDIGSLVGDAPSRFVHPELVHRVPGARDWLGTRSARDAALAHVLGHIAAETGAGGTASGTALSWLDDHLAGDRDATAHVRSALAAMPCLVDDQGVRRRPRELVVEGAHRIYGGRRGDWSPGARLTRLASALQIPRRPGKRSSLAFLAEIVSAMDADAALTTAEPGLLERLPRCLDLLIEEGGRGPDALPVACDHGATAMIVVVPGDVTVVLPGAPDAPEDAAVMRMPDSADAALWRSYLRPYGVIVADEDTAPADTESPARAQAVTPRREAKPVPRARPEPPPDVEPEGPGLISRIRDWFRSGDDDDRPDSPDPAEPTPRDPPPGHRAPPRQPRTPSRPGRTHDGTRSAADTEASEEAPPPVDQRSWFRADRSLESQLGSNAAWLADREHVAAFGLAHAPALLPLPYRYAMVACFADFDRRRQSWHRLVADARMSEGGGDMGRVQLRGRLPAGEAVVPVPLYGRVVDVKSKADTQLITAADRTVMLSRDDAVVTISIALSEAPDFTNARAADVPRVFTQSIVSDQELPDEAHDLVASLAGERSALHVAETVRSFVQERYAYDPTYLEDPAIAAWLRQRTRSRSNIHVAALHAGRDADHLGRGVCYELNTLACELMRRAGLPAAVATGWTFDRGYVDEPDHLWAVALLDAGDGPRWLPVDASTTRTGRPLHASHRPPGPWTADVRRARKVREPEWAKSKSQRRRAPSVPINDLLRVARYVERATGEHIGTRDELLDRCRRLLADPERAEALGQLLRDMDQQDTDDTHVAGPAEKREQDTGDSRRERE